MKKEGAAAAIIALLLATPALANSPFANRGPNYTIGGGSYSGPMIYNGYNQPVYNGVPTVGPQNFGTGTSYAPNYQFNNPNNMVRMTSPGLYGGYGGYGYGGYGYGGYSPYGYAPYGMYGTPTLIGGSNFGVTVGGRNLNFWRAPSGYYYPWLNNPVGMGYSNMTVLQVQGGNTQQARPPVTTMLSDMIKYIDTQHADGKLSDGDFTSMKRRALDLQSKAQDLMVQQDGVLDPDTEQQLRKDVDSLGAQLSHRVQP